MASPLFNEHLSLPQGCEDLQVQQLVAKLRVEALAVSVFPRAPRFDVKRLDADAAKPGAHLLGDKLGPIVGSNVIGRSVLGEMVSKAVEHIVRSQAPRNHNRRRSTCELINHGKHPERPAILRAILDKVIAP